MTFLTKPSFRVHFILVTVIAFLFSACEKQLKTPGNFTVSQGTYLGVVHFSWDPVPDAQNYNIVRQEPESSEWIDAATSVGTEVDDYGFNLPDHKIEIGKHYKYRISAGSSDANDSDYINANQEGWTYEPLPVIVTASFETNGYVTVSWTEPNLLSQLQNFTSAEYKIYRKNASTQDFVSAGTIKGETLFTDTYPGDDPQYKVEARYSYSFLNMSCGTSNSLAILESGISVATGGPEIPTITTTAISSLTTTTALSGGNITSDGGAPVTERGVCWSSTQSDPSIDDSYATNGTGTGSFEITVTGLTPGTIYYIRAYATNRRGTAYGSVLIFTTNSVAVPTLTTSEITSITTTTASSGGNITDDGGATITESGVCWSTTSDPTISDSKTSDGTTTGSFTSSITGLTANTTYYLRAYATNSFGTGYGISLSFTTEQESGVTETDADGNVYNTVTIGTQVWMVENLMTTKYNDNTSIPLVSDSTTWANLTTPGYCWLENDEATYKATYGALYNWYSVNTGKLCPAGWHVPSDADWTALSTYLGGETVAGGKLKEAGTAHWSLEIGATNETGFTALPGGIRAIMGFGGAGGSGHWWSSTEKDSHWSWSRQMDNWNNYLWRSDTWMKDDGLSVRCLQD